MNPEELKNAVREVRGGRKQVTWDAESAKEYNDALDLVLDLAESVLSVAGKMPQKINHNHGGACGSGNFCPPSYAEAEAYNKAIDACILAFAGMGLSVDEMIGFAAQGYCTKRNEKKELDAELIEDVCYAIHKAWEGKVRG